MCIINSELDENPSRLVFLLVFILFHMSREREEVFLKLSSCFIDEDDEDELHRSSLVLFLVVCD